MMPELPKRESNLGRVMRRFAADCLFARYLKPLSPVTLLTKVSCPDYSGEWTADEIEIAKALKEDKDRDYRSATFLAFLLNRYYDGKILNFLELIRKRLHYHFTDTLQEAHSLENDADKARIAFDTDYPEWDAKVMTVVAPSLSNVQLKKDRIN